MIDYSDTVFASRTLQKNKWQVRTGPARLEKHNGHNPSGTSMEELVLIIDDSPAMIEVLSDVLSFLNCSVLAALNGQEGVSLFKENGDKISAVILDMNMPIMSGEKTLRELRQCNPDIQVIISSSISEEEARRRCSAKGEVLSHFLSKPYDLDQAAQLLQTVLSR